MPILSEYSLNTRSRSASRTRWISTCFAVWMALRPNSAIGSGNVEHVADLRRRGLVGARLLDRELERGILDRLDHGLAQRAP